MDRGARRRVAMKSEKELTLDTDRLLEELEAPRESQPVVVVHYRSRGVPSWVFFPLMFLVPAIAIVVYHRMVVERYRVQATQARQALEGLAANDRADHDPWDAD